MDYKNNMGGDVSQQKKAMETDIEKMMRNGIPEVLFTNKVVQNKDEKTYKNTMKQLNE